MTPAGGWKVSAKDHAQRPFAHDPASGQVATITDPLNRTVGFAYDMANRVTAQTLPDTRVIGFGYDGTGNVTRITPPGRPDHTFDYTPVDLQEKYIAPATDPPVALRETSYAYNEDLQLEQIDRPDGRRTTLTYNAPAGRLSEITVDVETRILAYEAPAKKLSAITGSDVVGLQIVYQGPFLQSETWTGPDVTGTVSVQYDTDLQVGSQTVAGNTVSFDYDPDGILTQAGALTLAPDPMTGFLSSTSLDSVQDSYTYTSFGEVQTYETQSSGTLLYRVAYTRNDDGRIHTKTEQVGSEPETELAYEYDPAGRLRDVRRRVDPETTYAHVAHYEYDPNGNRVPDANSDSVLTFTQAGTLATAEYDDQDRLLGTIHGPTSTSYTYSDNGELATKTDGVGVTTYSYDVLGNLRTAVLPTSDEIEYVIDAKNRRVGKKLNGTLVRRWLYDEQLRIAAEFDGSGAVVSRFVYGTKVNVPEYMVRNGLTFRLVTDLLGSPRLVIDTTDGSVVQRIDYDEFGRVLTDTNPGFQPFGFAGGLYDNDIRLVRFGARDYDSQIGRWTAKDPLGLAGGSNLFAYVLNDPINLFDPQGFVSLTTDMTNGTTTFDPRPEDPFALPITVPSSNRVARRSLPGADAPLSTPDVRRLRSGNSVPYGPNGAYIDTGDPRGRDLHGGGSCPRIPDPYAPRQGWCPTLGCTRLQNEDIQALGDAIEDFQRRHPGVPIPYERYQIPLVRP